MGQKIVHKEHIQFRETNALIVLWATKFTPRANCWLGRTARLLTKLQLCLMVKCLHFAYQRSENLNFEADLNFTATVQFLQGLKKIQRKPMSRSISL